jgi:hypothetical protein
MNYFVLDPNPLVLSNIILDTRVGYNVARCVLAGTVLLKKVLAVRLQEREEKWNRESVWERKNGTQNITLVFHSNHLKICVGEAFIKGIHSCQKIKF